MEINVIEIITNLGIPGLLFYMWYTEQTKSKKYEESTKKLLEQQEDLKQFYGTVVEVVKNNTEAFTKFYTLMDVLDKNLKSMNTDISGIKTNCIHSQIYHKQDNNEDTTSGKKSRPISRTFQN